MTTYIGQSYIKENIWVRTYSADTFQEANTTAHEHGGTIERIFNGFKHVYRIRVRILKELSTI